MAAYCTSPARHVSRNAKFAGPCPPPRSATACHSRCSPRFVAWHWPRCRRQQRHAAQAAAALALKFEACRLEHPLGLTAVPAECATLDVPEDRAATGGRRIGLFVARIPALSRNHAGDPLFVLAGGPGLGATTFYTSVAPGLRRASAATATSCSSTSAARGARHR